MISVPCGTAGNRLQHLLSSSHIRRSVPKVFAPPPPSGVLVINLLHIRSKFRVWHVVLNSESQFPRIRVYDLNYLSTYLTPLPRTQRYMLLLRTPNTRSLISDSATKLTRWLKPLPFAQAFVATDIPFIFTISSASFDTCLRLDLFRVQIM
jgi:hypothetical protein